MNVKSPGRAMGVIVGGDFSDPTNERIILLSAAGLVLIGLGLLIGTIVWWHRGRQEHPVLAPLEVMGGRAWARAPEGDRRRRLDQVRLAGAGATEDELVYSDQVDLEALVRSVPQAFDDLREPGLRESGPGESDIEIVPGVVIEQPEAVPPAADAGDVVEVADVDATTFSAEPPPGDPQPVADPLADPLVNGKAPTPVKRVCQTAQGHFGSHRPLRHGANGRTGGPVVVIRHRRAVADEARATLLPRG